MSDPMSDLNGPFGWLTPAITRLTEAEPEFARHAVHMDRAAMHTLGLIVSHAQTAAWGTDDWRALARDLRFAPRKDIAARHAPGAPLSAFNLSRKIKGRAWKAPTYRRFAALCRDANARKWMAHAPTICATDLLVLSRLPPAFRDTAFVYRARQKGELVELRYRIAVLRRAYPETPDHALARMLEQKEPGRSFWDFQRGFIHRLPFPAPPWPGDDRLRPICSYRALERTALEFRNCVRDRAAYILTGESALYVYFDGTAPVGVVEIVRHAVFGWEFHEAQGPDNHDLTPDHRYEILRRLRAAGISSGRGMPMLDCMPPAKALAMSA
jgi:hypothetical protein